MQAPIRAHCYKTFNLRNLLIFVISQSVCTWQPSLIFAGKARSLPQSGAPKNVQPYSQTLDQAGQACQGQTLQLIANICKLRTQKVNNILLRPSHIKLKIHLCDKHSSLFCCSFLQSQSCQISSIITKICCILNTTLHFLRNLQMGPIGQIICNWQAFPAW